MVQGCIQALLGGSFKDGAIAGFASGLADLAGAGINEVLAANMTLSPAETFAARSFARVHVGGARAGQPERSRLRLRECACRRGGRAGGAARDAVGSVSGGHSQARAEQFLQTQQERGVARIDIYGETMAEVLTNRPNSFTAMEIKYLEANAQNYGYVRIGNSCIQVK
jgi:hypothetical protein